MKGIAVVDFDSQAIQRADILVIMIWEIDRLGEIVDTVLLSPLWNTALSLLAP